MIDLLNIEKTVFQQLQENKNELSTICKAANVPRMTIQRWNARDPLTISHLKSVNDMVQLLNDLDELEISFKFKKNSLIMSWGGWQEFTGEPIRKQIIDICNVSREGSRDLDFRQLMRKIVKVCRK